MLGKVFSTVYIYTVLQYKYHTGQGKLTDLICDGVHGKNFIILKF